jgi:hypothetical protein
MTTADQFPSHVDSETAERNPSVRGRSRDLQENLIFPVFTHSWRRTHRIRDQEYVSRRDLLPDFHPHWAWIQLALAGLSWGIVILVVWQ